MQNYFHHATCHFIGWITKQICMRLMIPRLICRFQTTFPKIRLRFYFFLPASRAAWVEICWFNDSIYQIELLYSFRSSHSLSLANFYFSLFCDIIADISYSVDSVSSLSPLRVFSSMIKKIPWRQKSKRYSAFYFLPSDDVNAII